MDNKSIIIFVGDYFPKETGFSIAFQNLQRAILKNDILRRIYVIAPEGNADPKIEGVVFYTYKPLVGIATMLRFSKTIGELSAGRQMQRIFSMINNIISESEVKAILVESMFQAWMVPHLIKNYKIPVVTRIHGTGPEYTKYFQKYEGVSYKKYLLDQVFKSRYIAATTSYYFDFFQSYFNDYDHFIDKYLFVIPNTVNLSFCERKTSDNELVFLQLGRMDSLGYHQKGYTDSLEALLYLENTMPVELLKKIRYITVGQGERENEFLSLQKKLSHIKAEHYSRLSNIEVRKKLNESDVVLIPSRCEGMSMFATEALAVGKPFIFTLDNGMKEMCIDGYNGIGVRCYNYLAVAKAINKFLERPKLIDEYAKHSREIFEKEFSYEIVAKKFKVMLDVVSSSDCK